MGEREKRWMKDRQREGREREATHVLPTRPRNLLQLTKHPLNRQRLHLKQRLLPDPTRVSNLAEVANLLVLSFDLRESPTARFADGFLQEGLADTEFEGLVLGGELCGRGRRGGGGSAFRTSSSCITFVRRRRVRRPRRKTGRSRAGQDAPC